MHLLDIAPLKHLIYNLHHLKTFFNDTLRYFLKKCTQTQFSIIGIRKTIFLNEIIFTIKMCSKTSIKQTP